jgi:protein-tyrosine phosphatase
MKRGTWSSGETVERGALSVSPRVGRRGGTLLDSNPRVDGCGPRVEYLQIEYLRNIRRKVWASNDARVRRRRVGMDISWLDDRIAVGGGIWHEKNMAEVSQAGITHIINMQKEFGHDTELAKPYGIKVLWNKVDDDFEPKLPEIFECGVRFAEEALKDPKAKLFIHCAAGVHRAPMMALALLVVREGRTVEEAMDSIQAKRPVADFPEVYVRSVEDFLAGRS